MKTIIAYKSKVLGAVYAITLAALIGMAVFFYVKYSYILFTNFAFLILLIALAILLIDYLLQPMNAVIMDENGDLILHKNIKLPISEVTDARFYPLTAHSIDYGLGNITILTRNKKYKYRYISDCQGAVQAIIKKKYQQK